jgi:hypothetical protein
MWKRLYEVLTRLFALTQKVESSRTNYFFLFCTSANNRSAELFWNLDVLKVHRDLPS